MLQLAFFRSPTFSAAVLCAAVVSSGMFGVFFFLSLFFQTVQGFSPLEAGLRYLPCTGVAMIIAPLAGRLAGHIGSRLPMSVGLGLNSLSLLLFVSVDAGTPYREIWPLLLTAGIGMSLVMTPMTVAVMNTVPRQRAGMASATTNASREVGGVFGIALLGAIVAHVFRDRLVSTLAALGISGSTAQRLAAQAGSDLSRLGSTQPRAPTRPVYIAPTTLAFVSGMHVALLVAGIALWRRRRSWSQSGTRPASPMSRHFSG